jgi:uncharacterized metal-binding protein YceD (DUF177 family)
MYLCRPKISKVKRKSAEFIIPFKGLKVGVHHFDFEIEGAFFADYGSNEELNDISGKAFLEFEKMNTMLVLNININGVLNTMCDRCGEDLDINFEGELKQMVKFGHIDSDFEMVDDIMIIPHEEHQINVLQPIYECLILSIPNKRVHPEGKCNPEAIEALKRLSPLNNQIKKQEKTDEVDPRWAALTKINKKKD